MPDHDDDGVELCPVPLDRAARVRLNVLSRVTGKPPLLLAAELLREMLEEDDRAHMPEASATLN